MSEPKSVLPLADPSRADQVFPTLTPDQIARVAKRGRPRPIQIGEVLQSAGEPAASFFLVTRGAEGSTLVVVGDVVGHGLAAARRASFVRATIALFAEYAEDPMTILRLANTALAERDPGTEFVTALCASISPRSETARSPRLPEGSSTSATAAWHWTRARSSGR